MHPTLPKNSVQLAAVQHTMEMKLLDLPNVVGVGIGSKINDKNGDTGQPCITAMVSAKLPKELLSESDMVPKTLGSKKTVTDVIEVGDLFAGDRGDNFFSGDPVLDYSTSEEQNSETFPATAHEQPSVQAATATSLTQRVRPAEGGYSVGHFKITAGTLGTCCYDLAPFPGMPQRYYILSNNHVLANSNVANIGDPILQPGPADGGVFPRDMIARLSRYVPIRFWTSTSKPLNYVDAAIAEGKFQDLDREIYWCGYIKDLYTAPQVGDILQKCGRTTGFTTGRVTAINATIDVNYGSGRVARFARQIVTTPMSAGGDSGSLVLHRNEDAAGLLFAGSSSATIINNILFVQSLLRVRVHEQ